MKHIMLIAGEASGDRHGANLMESLKTMDSHIRFTGLGGPLMRRDGQEQLYDIKDLAVMGLTEVLKRLFFFKRVFKETLDFIEKEKPDALVLIDYPGFNVRIAERSRRRGSSQGRIKIIYYISPQVWAWGKGRVKKIGNVIDRMLVIFPFEEEIYRTRGIPVSFVGHPLLDELKDISEKGEARKKIGLPQTGLVIGILPGSRLQEIELILPVMLKTALLLKNKFNARFLIPVASGRNLTIVENELAKSGLDKDYRDGIFKIINADAPLAISASDLIITASGTATLETAVLERPMVIVYKVPFLTYLVLRRIIKLTCIGMVNILLKEKAFPEFIQYNARPDEIFKTCSQLLEDRNAREKMLENLKKVKLLLGNPGAGLNTAREIWGVTYG